MRFQISLEAQELREVCGKRTDLYERGNEIQMTEYIVRNRLELRPVMRGPPGTDTVDGKGQIIHERLTLSLKVQSDSEPPPYRLELIRARVFTRDKVTPLNKSNAADEAANDHPKILIETDSSKASAPHGARGRKILNMAYKVPISPTIDHLKGSTEFLMLSFFDMTDVVTGLKVENKNETKLPSLRLIAYNPQHSYKLKTMIAGPDLIKMISSRGVVDGDLLLPSRRLELAKIIAKCIRLQRRRNALPNILTVPLEQALEEEEARKSALKDQIDKKEAENASRARKEQLRFRKAEIEQKEKDFTLAIWCVMSELLI